MVNLSEQLHVKIFRAKICLYPFCYKATHTDGLIFCRLAVGGHPILVADGPATIPISDKECICTELVPKA